MILEAASFGVKKKKKTLGVRKHKGVGEEFQLAHYAVGSSGASEAVRRGRRRGKEHKEFTPAAERDLDSLPQSVRQLLSLYVWQR